MSDDEERVTKPFKFVTGKQAITQHFRVSYLDANDNINISWSVIPQASSYPSPGIMARSYQKKKKKKKKKKRRY